MSDYSGYKAGDYARRFEWLKRTLAAPDAFGGKAPTYTSQGYLWGAIEDQAGGEEAYLDGKQASVRATIRLRNYPAVAAWDELRDVRFNEVWRVLDVARGDNEMILSVYRAAPGPP